MSLLSEAMEDCRYIDKTTAPDGYGGVKPVWSLGASFSAAFVLDISTEARRAEKEGVKNLYTITTEKAITLMGGDIIKRLSDGKLFKVTSDGKDKNTPSSASLNMRVVSAEAIESLPGGITL